MRWQFTIGLMLALVLGACSESERAGNEAPEVELDTYEKKLSYATAFIFHGQTTSQELPLDRDAFLMGLNDAFGEAEPRMSLEEMQAVGQTFLEEVAARSKVTIEAGEVKTIDVTAQSEFLYAHAQEPEVVRLASGLQYRVLEYVEGPSPTLEDLVTVNYRGTLIDGTEFDSSYARGEPATFPLNRVIRGWQEALQLMSVGSRWKIVLPAELAYGVVGSGDTIPPGAVLVFEIELLGIVDDTAAAEGAGEG